MTQLPFFTAEENARRLLRRVTEPMVDVRELVDVDLVIANSDFRRTQFVSPVNAHPEGLKVRNARILFETGTVWNFAEWGVPLSEQGPGIVNATCGIELLGAPFDCDGLHVEGAPKCGVVQDRGAHAIVKRMSSTRCHIGAFFGTGGSTSVQVDGFRFWDGWGPPSQKGYPADGWVSTGRQAIKNMEIGGHVGNGVKFCGPGILQVDNLTTPQWMMQGRDYAEGNQYLRVAIRDILVSAAYRDRRGWYNLTQISYGVLGTLMDSLIVGTDSESGINVTGGSHLEVRDVQFASLAYGLDLDVSPPPNESGIQDTFEQDNEFRRVGQKLRRIG